MIVSTTLLFSIDTSSKGPLVELKEEDIARLVSNRSNERKTIKYTP